MTRAALFVLAAACATAALAPLPGMAQEAYPNRPIRAIVPLPPGSGMGLIIRVVGEELQARTGQPLVVDNRPGGNFIIGANACAAAIPDGYTWCTMTADALSLNPVVVSKLPYDPERDFKPVTNIYFLTAGLFVKSGLPVNSFKDLQAYAASSGGKLNWGTLGPSTSTDMSRAWLADRWNSRIAGIPYKGGAPIFQALGTGEIDMSWIGVYNGIGLLKAGRIKLLAVGSLKRTKLAPEIPTITELGIADMPAARTWWGLFVPAGTPDAIIKRINAEVVQIFKLPKVIDFMESEASEIDVGTPEQLGALVRSYRQRYAEIVKKFNMPTE
jgi:tripartite-type tricarboxylate transporter receptor subunit TctC